MLEYIAGVNALVPIVLTTPAGSALNGATYNQLSFTVIQANGNVVNDSPTVSNFFQITGTAYASQGYYNYSLTGSLTLVTGILQYCAYVSGAAPYFGVVKVVAGDTTAIYNRIGQPNYGTVTNDIANVGVTAGSGGFTSADRAMLSATYYTASLLPSDPASNSIIFSYVTQSFWTGDRQNLLNISASVSKLPTDPASNSIINGYVNTAVSTIDNNVNSNFTTIKGGAFIGTYDSLHSIGVSASYIAASGALSSTLVTAINYLAGIGFITGTDDLHGISVQIQGITPSSGGGGFSTTDRSMLASCYTSTLPLPVDPASNSYLSGIITSSAAMIMGSGSFGAGSGSTIYEVWNNVNYYVPMIWGKVSPLPAGPASTTDVNNARDYLAGVGYVQASNSLVVISNEITTGSYSSTDRTWVSSTYVSMSVLLSQENTTNNNVLLVKAKTDNLPADPVSTAWILVPLNTLLSASSVSGGFSTTDRNNIIWISQTLGHPQSTTVSTDIFNIASTLNSQGTQISNIYSKTSNLPVDPVSTTYVQLVSSTLSTQIGGVGSNVGTVISNIATVSASILVVNSKIGTPATTVSQDIANVNTNVSSVGTNAASAAASSANAASYASTAATNSTTAANNSLALISTVGTPTSGSLAADVKDIRNNMSSISISGTVVADLGPVTKIIGAPNRTLSDDVRQIGKIVQDIQKKIS